MTRQYGEVLCLCCGQRVSAVQMNGEWRREYHHNRNGRACDGSRSPVIDSTVIRKVSTHEQPSSSGDKV